MKERNPCSIFVIPAKAGIHGKDKECGWPKIVPPGTWIPAFAGMTTPWLDSFSLHPIAQVRM